MKIKKLILQTSIPQILAEFYKHVLQLPVKGYQDEFVISLKNSEIVFKPSRQNQNPFYHFAINIPANTIDPAKAWLAKKVQLLWLADYNSDIADFVNWHAKSIYFFDPAGNIVELIARFDLQNATTEAFSSKHLLSVSEMGLVYKKKEIDTRSEKLIQQFNLTCFTKQPPLPEFKAIGDDEGLFIIVTEKRNWYPTNKPSGIFPVIIEFDNNKTIYHLSL